jgi:superfamily II DNA helicase RecQ
MTATCPPELENRLLEKVGIKQGCRIIRAPTSRREISFNFHSFSNLTSAADKLKADVGSALESYHPGEKAIVFCRSHDTTTYVAGEVLECPSYHRDDRTPKELKEALNSYINDNDQKIVVATSLLGAGVDIPHVRDIWHFGIPWSLIDFAQETGRAGRDGRPASSHVFTWKGNLSHRGKMNYTEDAMRQLLTSTKDCRRTLMGQVLDGVSTSCTLLGANLCDNCRVGLKEQHPESGAGTFEDLEPILSPPAPPSPSPPPQVPEANLSRFSPPSAVRDAGDLPSLPPWVAFFSLTSCTLTGLVSSSGSRALVVYKADGSSLPPQQRKCRPGPSET